MKVGQKMTKQRDMDRYKEGYLDGILRAMDQLESSFSMTDLYIKLSNLCKGIERGDE